MTRLISVVSFTSWATAIPGGSGVVGNGAVGRGAGVRGARGAAVAAGSAAGGSAATGMHADTAAQRRKLDGTISADELRLCLQTQDQTLTDDEISNMISQVDENQDGMIDYEEFLGMMMGQMKK